MSDATSPWHAAVAVAQIPDEGMHCDLEAGESERKAIASLAGLRELPRLAASLDLAHAGGGRVRVTGRITASVGQTCVVTLEPLTNAIDEAVDVMFAPETQAVAAAPGDKDGHEDLDEDPPEAIVNGQIDLGALAVEFLVLALDPYPRKPGAVFEPVIAPADPADHPFAALEALKKPESPPKPRKSKGK